MIQGIGIDIIEIDRVKKAIERTRGFMEKLFTEKELEFYSSKVYRAESIAGNFAAKEAVSKAIGTGFRQFSVKDIEIFRDPLGKPIVSLSEKVYKVIGQRNVEIHLSISHNKTNAIAYAVMEVL